MTPNPRENPSSPSNVTVRAFRPADVPAMSAILEERPAASSWSEDSLRESAQSGTTWVAEQEGRLIGFLIGRAVADEFEILNLAVARPDRRRGVATQLLKTVVEWLRTVGTRRAYLEVRESNEAAMALYVPHGFSLCGRRARYYQYPVEDAVLLSWDSEKDMTP